VKTTKPRQTRRAGVATTCVVADQRVEGVPAEEEGDTLVADRRTSATHMVEATPAQLGTQGHCVKFASRDTSLASAGTDLTAHMFQKRGMPEQLILLMVLTRIGILTLVQRTT
jgi:hypothetical protein